MEKIKWMIIGLLLITQARAQVLSSVEVNKSAKLSFKSVYETNQYFNDLEESIELKYANLKVPYYEKMEGPQDSLWQIGEKISSLRELIRLEEFNFIYWEKNTDRNNSGFAQERADKQEHAKNEIVRMRRQIDALEAQKPAYILLLKEQEVLIQEFDKQKEKELDRAKLERQSALAKMYRA